MQSLSRSGIGYRTHLMGAARAEAFRRCLAANPRFGEVSVQLSMRARTDRRHYVTFTPANPKRVEAILTRQQDTRARRAEKEGEWYLWAEDPDHGFWWCRSASGNVYEVEPRVGTCTCPDHEYRCQGNGVRCKHLIAFHAGIGEFHRAIAWDRGPLPEPFGPAEACGNELPPDPDWAERCERFSDEW